MHERTPEQHVQYLLHLARTGQVTPEQMPKLNALIAVFARQIPSNRPPAPVVMSPPVVVVEFPENPSVSFLLPLWHCAVERRHAASPDTRRSIVLSFFGPAIGSKAAGNSGKAEAARVLGATLLADPNEAPPPQTDTPGRKKRDKKAEQQTRAHEVYPVTWHISSEFGVDERLWECFGRVPGCITTLPGGRQVWASEQSHRAYTALKESFARRMKQMSVPNVLPEHVAPEDEPEELASHVSDRYAMRVIGGSSRPQPKRKVAMVSDSRDGHPGVRDLLTGGERPKRKRHVATHNPDGSIKSCGACGQTKTPMWRRGPKGPSQLCNACGAKWKAGRLNVPDVPPPPVFGKDNPHAPKDDPEVKAEAPPEGPAPAAATPHESATQPADAAPPAAAASPAGAPPVQGTRTPQGNDTPT